MAIAATNRPHLGILEIRPLIHQNYLNPARCVAPRAARPLAAFIVAADTLVPGLQHGLTLACRTRDQAASVDGRCGWYLSRHHQSLITRPPSAVAPMADKSCRRSLPERDTVRAFMHRLFSPTGGVNNTCAVVYSTLHLLIRSVATRFIETYTGHVVLRGASHLQA